MRGQEELAQLYRLGRFRAQHPAVVITQHSGSGFWQAWIPAGNGGSVLTRYILRELLDKLDEVLAPEPDQGSPDVGAAAPSAAPDHDPPRRPR